MRHFLRCRQRWESVAAPGFDPTGATLSTEKGGVENHLTC